MKDQIKSIYKVYLESAAINNTTRNTDSFLFAPRNYTEVKDEFEETFDSTSISEKLKQCYDASKKGTKEEYKKIFLDLTKIIKTIESQILK